MLRKWMGLLCCIVLVATGCSASPPPPEDKKIKDYTEKEELAKIQFGNWTDDKEEDIEKTRKTFEKGEPITLAFDSDPLETKKLRINVLKMPEEKLMAAPDVEVKPEWEGLVYETYHPDQNGKWDAGTYVVRVFKKKELVAEGKFKVK